MTSDSHESEDEKREAARAVIEEWNHEQERKKKTGITVREAIRLHNEDIVVCGIIVGVSELIKMIKGSSVICKNEGCNYRQAIKIYDLPPLAATQATEEAYGLREEGHSIFTYFLIRGLGGNEKSVDSEGNVTPDSLGNFVYREIMNLPVNRRPKQKPVRKTQASGEIILAEYPDLKAARIEIMLTSLTKLLNDGNIEEFNKKRNQIPTNLLNFSQIDLRDRSLSLL